MPVGVAALVDDPVHPLEVAQEWHAALPRSALVTTTLAAFGADPGALGRAAALAWLRAAHFARTVGPPAVAMGGGARRPP